MIYDKLDEIHDKLEALTDSTGTIVFASGVQIGMYNLNFSQLPMCFIKGGAGPIDRHRDLALEVHVIAVYKDPTDIEETLGNNAELVIRALHEIDSVIPTFYTTDQDVFEPYGQTVSILPPFGAFRITCEVHGVI